MSRLVRDLNDVTRFVLLGLGKAGNGAGAEAALTWQSGYLQGVDYRLGFPSPLDDLVTLDELLNAGETDAVIVVGDADWAGVSDVAKQRLATLPVIAIGAQAAQFSAGVAIPTAAPGFDEGGTVTPSTA